jgi:hypothetical protein
MCMKRTIFMYIIAFISLLVLSACGQSTQSAPAYQTKTGEQALSVLGDRIRQDDLYQGRFAFECLSFSLEGQSDSGYDISIREKHGGTCPGDPNTAPLVDQFRVTPDGNILWLQPDGSGTYLPYDLAKPIIQNH